jgi:uncharacterized protein
MPSMFHQPVAAVTGPLEPRGQREGADSGDPQISWTAFDSSDDVKVGVWEAAPGGWPIVNRENTETCYIVSGRATITDGDTGAKNEISAGHVVTFPRGWSGRWDVTETIRKVYCIAVPATGQ